jgi:O-acetyl-ADP-ribose deacetylase
MTTVIFKVGNIVEEKTEGLICSGNIHLNMSGGVNGELLSRGGIEMQKQLHSYLAKENKMFVDPGFVMKIGPEPFHFSCIVYSVSIDAWYDSSEEIVYKTLVNALNVLQESNCYTVAIPALATGYGHLKLEEFGRFLKISLDSKQWLFEEIRIVHIDEFKLKKVRKGYDNS